MEVTAAQYVRNEAGDENVSVRATIDGVELFTPLDPDNRHYAAILEWVEAGNTIQEAD